MDVRATRLVLELKTLRKGRGLQAPHLGERVGPTLRSICGIVDSDHSAETRRKVEGLLRTLATHLPDDFRVAVSAAFALEEGVSSQFYQERVAWVAKQLGRDHRTARRRVDEGIEQIAELAAARIPVSDSSRLPDSGPAWHTEELRVALTLDLPEPEALEFRRIVADRDELDELDLALTLTSPGGRAEPAEIEDLHVDVFYGGRLVAHKKESADRFGFVLALSRELRREERHEFLLRFRVPRHRTMQPHFVCVPRHQCDLFDLHVRFGPSASPRRVWKLADTFQRDVDDPTLDGSTVSLDDLGEVHLQFSNLTPGLAYGVRWDDRTTTDGPGRAER